MHQLIAKTILSGLKLADGKLPDWFLLFKAGWVEIEGAGKFLVDQQAFDVVQAQLFRRGVEVVVDYEHQTVKGGKAPAAGWIRELRWAEGEGIYARTDWTEAASGHIQTGEYRYFSPVFFVAKKDKRLAGLHSVALTNAPKTNHLTPILAKLGPAAQAKEQEMKFLEILISKLGLKPEATEDDVVTAVAELKDAEPQTVEVVAKEILEAVELDEGDASAVVASIHALKQEPKGMVSRKEFNTLQAKLTQRDADDAVDAAMQAGKITPDQKQWAEDYAKADLAGFNQFVAKAPVVVPLSKLPGKKKEAADAEITDATLTVAKMMGVTQEDLKQYGN